MANAESALKIFVSHLTLHPNDNALEAFLVEVSIKELWLNRNNCDQAKRDAFIRQARRMKIVTTEDPFDRFEKLEDNKLLTYECTGVWLLKYLFIGDYIEALRVTHRLSEANIALLSKR